MINNEEFKQYQRMLNAQRVNELKKKPLPTNKPLLAPDVTFKTDLTELEIPNIEINPSTQPAKEDKPVKSNSVVLF